MSASGLKRLSERRNPLLAFPTAVNVEVFRTGLEQGLPYSDASRWAATVRCGDEFQRSWSPRRRTIEPSSRRVVSPGS